VRRAISRHEEIRRRCGLTQAELAARAGYARAYVSRVEIGDAKPSARYRAAIAKALHVPEALIFPPEMREAGIPASTSRDDNSDGNSTA
jgi:transcriptional regulator with XRE-family HTH domain